LGRRRPYFRDDLDDGEGDPDLPGGKDAPVYAIIVSTLPAILIQSNGDPQPARIPGTSLVYVENSPNDVFFDTATYVYYVDAGGEWYRCDALKDSGNWQPVPPQALPADFSTSYLVGVGDGTMVITGWTAITGTMARAASAGNGRIGAIAMVMTLARGMAGRGRLGGNFGRDTPAHLAASRTGCSAA